MNSYALIGRKLGHSFSARYFNRKFRADGTEARYELAELPEIEAIHPWMASRGELRGFNVTVPYKEAILPHLHALTPTARLAGAVNAVRVERPAPGEPPRLIGHNTDVEGFRAALLENTDIEALRNEARKSPALVCGTGGASKAVAVALRELEIPFLTLSRSRGKGDLTYPEVTETELARSPLIVNATPLGMWPDTETLPPLPYGDGAAAPGEGPRLAFDLTYNPPRTAFMARMEAMGFRTENGLRMLTAQAEAAWRFWNEEGVAGLAAMR